MDLILDLTISGAIAVKREFPVDAVTVFVLPPSIEELQTRLQYRLRETEEQIQERVANALCNEIPQIGNFDYVLVNDILNDTRDHLLAIISAERLKYKRNKGILEELNLKGEKI
jgi:guanylate kinase